MTIKGGCWGADKKRQKQKNWLISVYIALCASECPKWLSHPFKLSASQVAILRLNFDTNYSE